MGSMQRWPECGAPWPDGVTCQDHFYPMLFWENEYPEKTLEAHHLMVLAYHLQHPGLYAPDGLVNAMSLLVEFVERGTPPSDMRRHLHDAVDSGKRAWKITGRPDARGAYAHAPAWAMVAGDVTARGVDCYAEGMRAWARSILDALKTSDNLPKKGT